MTIQRVVLALLIFFVASNPDLGNAAQWYVDASVPESGDGTTWGTAFKRIHRGMDAASDGDTVIVARGTYIENIHFRGKNVVLLSTDPLDPDTVANTIIDGNGVASVVSFAGTEEETCILSGFTIRNGKADFGGGIRGREAFNHTHATIENNVITGNTAGRGGGLYDCDGIIRNNVIADNTAEGAVLWGVVYGDGAGLYRCDGTIEYNTITGNSAKGGGCPTLPCVYADGGGLAFCQGTIRHNTISANTADRGGGLFDCDGKIESNLITDNPVNREGGGLAYCDGWIVNNTITGNSALDEGGGLAYCDARIDGNTITGNAARGGEGYGGHGGGLSDCDGPIAGNLISGNSGSRGGGLTFCDGEIRNNTISENSVKLEGGGLYFCHGVIRNNAISANSVQRDGGGLHNCWGTIQNNLIVGNSAGRHGGGLAACRGPLQNNTIAANSATETGGGLYACPGTLGNSIVWGNTAQADAQVAASATPIFSCIADWTGGGEGNIVADPRFVNPSAGDYHLEANSPCIETGANYYWFVWPQRDLDGNCRLVGQRVDMGCYEYGATADGDGDLLSDLDEFAVGSSAVYSDSDGDGLRDGLEVLRGSNPLKITPPRTIRVPADIPRIQTALLLAVRGEEIVVAPGTYRENVHFSGTDLILRSSDPENPDVVHSTILDGGEAGPTVSFAGSEKDACALSGFTITGGSAQDGGGICGGTSEKHTHATIENNTITGNWARTGGGLCWCDGTIRNNTITENSAERYGGGLVYCDGIIQGNTIHGNSSGGHGGGLYGCHGSIRNNTIAANRAEGTWVWRGQVRGHGGGLGFCDGSIVNNVIVENWAKESGGGMSDCDGTVLNNLIMGNSATDHGGGLYRCRGTILNNSIIGNRADNSGGGLGSCQAAGVQNCILWGNAAGQGDQVHDSSTPTFSCIEGWTAGGEGNIGDDPLFVDPDGPDDDPQTYEDNDYHLSWASPCVDAGKNRNWMWQGAVDFDGNPRILYGASSLTVDIGAYEYASQEGPGALWHVDGSVSESGTGISWEKAFKTIQEGIEAASDGNIVTVAAGTYSENLRLNGKSITLRSTDPLDSQVVAKTIISGNLSGPVVTFDGTETEACLLSGFTIRDGKAAYGGGICGGTADAQTRARIVNNVITSNTADYGGGIAYCGGSIENNTISDNRAVNLYGEGGGMAYCEGIVRNNTIIGNRAVWRGGGISRCPCTIRNNTVSRNSASSGGGLAYCDGCVENNTVSENSATIWGGGLYRCGGMIRSNIIIGGSADWGGGLAYCGGLLRNNTVLGNKATTGGGGMAFCSGTIRNCIVWGNTAASHPQMYDSPVITYSCIQSWAGGGEGNIASDPLFVDPDGPDDTASTYEDNDYRLLADSPCIDAGMNEEWMQEAVERDGNPRIFYGTSSMTVDMGAYEYNSFLFRILSIVTRGGDTELTWTSRPGDRYTVWSCRGLHTEQWVEEAIIIPSGGDSTTWVDPDATSTRKFYRVTSE